MVKKLIALLSLLIFLPASIPAFATLQAFVNRNPVAPGESLTLTLKSDASLDSDPDLSVLQQDFDVLGQSSGSSLQIINGHAARSVQWQISLMPKRSGQLIIPSIKAGRQATQPIALNVTRSNPATQASGELFLEVSAQPLTAYVQQQIIYTVRLYSAANLGNQNSLSDPAFPGMDAVVKRLGDDRSFQTTRKGVRYAVIERRYAVYPQKAGQFSSSAVQFDGDILDSHQGAGEVMFDPFNQSSHHKRISSKILEFTIKPAPASLPANKLELSEQWSVNPPVFTAGEPVTRTLIISAQGLTASQLPAPDSQPVEGLKLYPDQPVLQDNQDDNGINGMRIQKIAILPEHAGRYTLPEIEVKWWNVKTDQIEVARLPARNITVLPGASSTAPAPDQAPALSSETAAPRAPSHADTTSLIKTTRWPWLSLLLGLGWLTTLILWWWQTHKTRPVNDESHVKEQSVRQLENALKQNCMKNDALQAKLSLLAWAKLHWYQHPPTSLTAMASRCQPELAHALCELDKTLYGQAGSRWQGKPLWQLFNQHRPIFGANQDKKPDALQPLYPTSP